MDAETEAPEAGAPYYISVAVVFDSIGALAESLRNPPCDFECMGFFGGYQRFKVVGADYEINRLWREEKRAAIGPYGPPPMPRRLRASFP